MAASEDSGAAGNVPDRPAGGWRTGITTETVILALFVGALAWAPFWLGSNRLTPWVINAIVFPGLAVFYELSLILRGASHAIPIRFIRLSAVLFATAASWALVQNATWTPTAWQHPIWQLASDVLGRPIAGSISIDRDLTAIALLRLATAASAFWLALQLGGDSRRARLLIWSIVGIGAVYAAVGLFALNFMTNGVVFQDIQPLNVVSSTFINRNHYATYAGIGLISVVALTHRLYRRELQESGGIWRLKIATVIDTTGGKGAFPLVLTVLILAALALTGSRGGVIATSLGLATLFVLNMRRRGGFGRQHAAFIILLALLFGAVFIGFSDIFVQRIATQGVLDQDRFMVAIVTIRSILSAPLVGFGYGTFISAFPMFRDDSVGVWDVQEKAHNTYLEVLQGLGVVFGTMLIVSIVLLVLRCLKGTTIRQREVTIPVIAVAVSVLVGMQAFVDFSLQIQAITLTYMAVLGVGVAQAVVSINTGDRVQDVRSQNGC